MGNLILCLCSRGIELREAISIAQSRSAWAFLYLLQEDS